MRKVVIGAAGIVSALTLLSRFFGLLRKLAQSWAMSDSLVATAYDTANTVPNVLFEVAAGGALAGAVIPVLSRYLAHPTHYMGDESESQQRLNRAASAMATWVLLAGIPLAVIVAVAAAPIISVVIPAADPSVHQLATNLLRVFAVQIPLYGLSVVFTGISHTYQHFLLPALCPLLSSCAVTATFIGYSLCAPTFIDPADLSWSQVALLGWGTTGGVVLFALPQWIVVRRFVCLRPTLSFPEGAGRATIHLAGAGLAAIMAQQIAIVVMMVTANANGGTGAYAVWNYAFAVFLVPYAVLAVPIATVVFPRIARCSDVQRMAELTARSTRLILIAGITAAGLLFALAKPAQVVIELGQPMLGLDTALRAMAPALLGYCLLYHGARVCYAAHAPRRVVIANTIGWLSVVLGGLIVHIAHIHGRVPVLIGLGGALSVGMTLGAAAMLWHLYRQLGKAALAGVARLVTRVIPVVIVASVIAWWVSDQILTLAGGTVTSAIMGAFAGALIIIGAAVLVLRRDRSAISLLRGSAID
ncbi:murein biosynthesis integral membrane protein MurJ [Trueperella sp. LYQ143]|uniref:murein biosynthesis integral membrane protein MurJ n=1 Tax=Trueperella sp. LYQ143 TaxID=3391059 RepID=UPI0039833033